MKFSVRPAGGLGKRHPSAGRVGAKTVRVVEEIGIRDDVKDEVRTITDTVPSTKVDVDDGRETVNRSGLIGGLATELAKYMEVFGSNVRHVGAIDNVDGTTIKLKTIDQASDGCHHKISTDRVKAVEAKVTLKRAAADTMSRWTDA